LRVNYVEIGFNEKFSPRLFDFLDPGII